MAFDFPSAPTVGQVYNGYVWDGEKWQLQGAANSAVRYDIAQGLNAAQQSQARANIDVTKKNYIINGAMMISQENGATAGTTNIYHPVDQFSMYIGSTGTATTQQVAGATQGGSPNRLRVTATVADTSMTTAEHLFIRHNIEGLRTTDLRLGAPSAKTVTLQFGVKAPAGTYCVFMNNSATDRSYVAEYIIAAGEANTDTIKSITVALDQTGTWLTDNTIGLRVQWSLATGPTYHTTANSWQAGTFRSTANQFNFMGTINNVFELFDVSLTEGTVAPPFVVPDYASELALCQRHYFKSPSVTGLGAAATVYAAGGVTLPTTMRAAPTVAGTFSVNTGSAGTCGIISPSANGFGVINTGANWTVNALVSLIYTATARL